MVRRLARTHEILQLRDKEGEQARAKPMATDKALGHNLPMEIIRVCFGTYDFIYLRIDFNS